MMNLLTEPEWNGRTMVSRTVASEPGLKVVVLQFAPGHELAEHQAPAAISLHFLAGEGFLLHGGEWEPVSPGSFFVLPAGEVHGVRATTYLTLLLTLGGRAPLD
jgi:quercetin dioxygenase-like cupin family protein